MLVAGENLEGDYISKTVRLPFEDKADNSRRSYRFYGPNAKQRNGRMLVDMVEFGSPAESAGVDFDWEIRSVVVDADRPMKEWVFVPALMLLIGLGFNQKRRARKEQMSA